MAIFLENKDGQRFKLTGDGGGLTEIPVATENEIGGIKSSTKSGSVNVNEDGITEVNDVVTVPGTGEFQFPQEFGDGPYSIICTEDNNPDDPQTGMPIGGQAGQVLTKKDENDYSVYWATPIVHGANIADNWYFANPVNQRGATEYGNVRDANGYTIDRWRIDKNITVLVKPGFIRLFRNTDGRNPPFEQVVEMFRQFIGKTLTISVIYRMSSDFPESNNIIRMGINYGTTEEWMYLPKSTDWALSKMTIDIPVDATALYLRPAQILTRLGVGSDTSNYIDLFACKVEFGSEQTLASVDASGNVSLLDPCPSRAIELLKCQRFYIPANTQYTKICTKALGANLYTTVPACMRIAPTALPSIPIEVYIVDKWYQCTIDLITFFKTEIGIVFHPTETVSVPAQPYLCRYIPALSCEP